MTPGGTGSALLERDAELATLRGAVAAARQGKGSVVFVAGDAGAGKTALARSFIADVGTRAAILTAACDPISTPPPLGFLRDLTTTSHRLRTLLDGRTNPFDVYETLASLLSEQPTALVIEDLHWADEASLDVVRLLVRRVGSMPAVVVITHRPDDPDRVGPLRHLLGDLATAPDAVRLDLRPLSLDAVAEMAATLPVDPRRIHAVSGGNPFFVTEILASGTHDVPRTVRDAVLTRLDACDGAARELTDVVALVSGPAEGGLLRRLGLLDDGVVADAIRAGLLEWTDERLRFRHEIARLVVAEAILPERTRELHQRIHDALAESPSGADAARLAHHAEHAHDRDATRRHAARAAHEAAAAGSFREAAAQFRRALRCSTGRPTEERADLLAGLSRACYLADDQLEAIAVVREAIALQRSDGTTDGEAISLVELAGYLRCRGHLDQAAAAAGRAESLVDVRSALRPQAIVRGCGATERLVAGDRGGALTLASEARELARAAGDDLHAGHAMVTAAAARFADDPAAGRAELEAALQFAEHTGQFEVGARALNSLGANLAATGRRADAAAALDRAIEYCSDRTHDLWRINAQALAARVALERGMWTAAVEYATAVLDDPRESPWPHHEALLVVATVRARRGDPGARAAFLDALAVEVPDAEVDAHVDRAMAAAELAWVSGHVDAIGGLVRPTMLGALDRGDHRAAARLRFWPAIADLEPGGVGDGDDAFGLVAAGSWSDAADEFERLELPYEAALTRSFADPRLAHERLVAMSARPAARWVARQLRASGIRDIDPLPHAGTHEHPAGLTRREAEVFALLAEGMRNADIADRLVISRRTVDHHVAAILRKSGAQTRTEAIARVGAPATVD